MFRLIVPGVYLDGEDRGASREGMVAKACVWLAMVDTCPGKKEQAEMRPG